MMEIRIEGGRALVDGRLEDTTIHVGSDAGVVIGIGTDTTVERTIDASGLLVLPGIVDIHGDAFERQMMPRPRVTFPLVRPSPTASPPSSTASPGRGSPACVVRRMRARSWGASSACGTGSAPTPGIIFVTRPITSTPSPKSSNGSATAGST
jgi:hypothetical protein